MDYLSHAKVVSLNTRQTCLNRLVI